MIRGLPVDWAAYEALDVAYTTLNAQRSLRLEDGALFVRRRGGLSLLSDPTRPSGHYNRVLGLDAESLDELVPTVALHGGHPRVDVPTARLQQPVADVLHALGYTPRRGLTWLAAPPAEVVARRLDGPVARRLGEGEADFLFDLMGSRGAGEPVPDTIRDKRRRFYCTNTFPQFVVEWNGRPVAWASLFVAGERGLLGNAFTLETHRGRGCQAALFAARAEHARELGLAWIVTDVTPSTTSHRNALRAGLRTVADVLWWDRRLV